jgi:hypothetical protein
VPQHRCGHSISADLSTGTDGGRTSGARRSTGIGGGSAIDARRPSSTGAAAPAAHAAPPAPIGAALEVRRALAASASQRPAAASSRCQYGSERSTPQTQRGAVSPSAVACQTTSACHPAMNCQTTFRQTPEPRCHGAIEASSRARTRASAHHVWLLKAATDDIIVVAKGDRRLAFFLGRAKSQSVPKPNPQISHLKMLLCGIAQQAPQNLSRNNLATLESSKNVSNYFWTKMHVWDSGLDFWNLIFSHDVVPGISWLVVEVCPCAVRVAHRFHAQDLLRRFHTHFPAVPRSTSVRVFSRPGRS